MSKGDVYEKNVTKIIGPAKNSKNRSNFMSKKISVGNLDAKKQTAGFRK